MIAIAGSGSKIAEEFMALSTEECRGVRLGTMIPGATKYLICSGLLHGRSIGQMMPDQIAGTFAVNFADVATFCDGLFNVEPEARVVVIGSRSGIHGSFDMAYAGAKASLHLYVSTKKLGPAQQLVCIAPGIIADAGQTVRRHDQERVEERARNHPKGRHCTSREVASLAAWLLGDDGEFVSGCTIRMDGGEK